jgi:hypothetical protein
METPHRQVYVLLPFRAVENQLLRCLPYDAPAVGVCRFPVSRLFDGGIGRYADSVLIAAGDPNTCEADLELSRVTTLKGRCDATLPVRRQYLKGERVRRPARCEACRGAAKPESGRGDSSRRVRSL